MDYIFPLFFAFLISITATFIIVRLRDTWAWIVAKPTSDRWHKTQVASFGGIAIFTSFVLSILIFQQFDLSLLKILFGGSIIFMLGLIDDIRPLPPHVKLGGQIVAASLMAYLGVHVTFTGDPLIYFPLTVLWITGITNAFNLLDNMDGLAGGIAITTATTLLMITFYTGGPLPTIPLTIFIGSILGFLLLNINPAKIFMGDCGAQFLGFMLACFAILDTWKSASNLFLMLTTPVLILGIPIFDTALVTLNRKIHGISVSQGGRDHTSHRMVALGVSERKTVAILWALSILFGLVALFAHQYKMESWGLLVSAAIVFILMFGLFLTEAKVYDSSPNHQNQKILSIPILHKRRIIEIAVDTIIIGGAYVLAYLLRYDWSLDRFYLQQLTETLPLIVIIKLTVLFVFGMYKGIWTYINFDSIGRMINLSFLASIASVISIVGLYRFTGFSRTLFIIDFILFLSFIGGSRAMLRAFRESVLAFPEGGLRLLVIGAGEASDFLLREIRKNRHWNLKPIALVDDDQQKMGKNLLGVPIRGTSDDISNLVNEHDIDQIIIAIPSIQSDKKTLITNQCRKSGAPFIAMESLEETLIQKITR